MKEHLLIHSCQRYVFAGPQREIWSFARNGPLVLETAEILLLTKHCSVKLALWELQKESIPLFVY